MERSEKTTNSFYKYCIVPMCTNTIKSAPDKHYFPVPRNPDLRKTWCKVMNRKDESATSGSYCCEDHFNLEEDTQNLIQYKIMAVQEGKQVILRLKKGILPHIFECQKNNKLTPKIKSANRRRLKLLQGDSITETDQRESNSKRVKINYCETVSSQSSLKVSTEHNEKLNFDTPVPVNRKTKRSKSHVNFNNECTNIDLSPLLTTSKNTSTSPLKSNVISGLNKNIISNNSVISLTSVKSGTVSKPESSSPESSCSQNESDSNRQFKNEKCSNIVNAVESKPNMLGLPKKSYWVFFH